MLLAAIGFVAAAAANAAGQPFDPGPDPFDPPEPAPFDTFADPATAPTSALGADTLVCNGNWRYPLTETRQEIGPARFARQRDLQRDLVITGAAFGYCEAAEAAQFADGYAAAVGPCTGMLKLAEKIDFVASNLFRPEEEEIAACLTRTATSGGDCEGVRGQLTTLRTYDQIIVDRAELVLSYEVCASPERGSNKGLREACEALEGRVAAELGPDGGIPGMFGLAAPLPAEVAAGVTEIAMLTDGRFLSVTPENFVGVRRSVCRFPDDDASGGMRKGTILERKDFMPVREGTLWSPKRGAVMWGMCNEMALADVNAASCRAADIYLDERGELHLNSPLTTRAQRREATMCIDVSDFHPDQPLMVTIGLDATGSVPERVWPGETMAIGELLDRKVTREDVLTLHVYGKANGISLAEVLRINGVTDLAENKDEACRMARSWVPVVDHEVPIGDPDRQAVIPLDYGRGRVGETQRLDEGDYILLWVRDIEPNGSVLVEYAKGQFVGYQPPPLLGEPVTAAAYDSSTGTTVPGTPPPPTGGGTELAMRAASVDQPLLPRRARYPGSRVLRLGTPKGNYEYPLRVCTRNGPAPPVVGGQGSACFGGQLIVDEKLFVHGAYHFGLRLYFGYTSFPVPEYAARPIGGGSFEVVESSSVTAEYDVAVLLAAYPFGRDPRRFSYNPLSEEYWKSAALLAGFGVRNPTAPWEDFYVGGSLPVANGVSLTLLAHIGLRGVALDVRAGDTFMSSDTRPRLEDHYTVEDAIVVGGSLGLSFDYDLFERAFTNIWERISPKGTFTSSGSSDSRSLPEGF